MVEKVTESIFYVGANDHDLDLFEGLSISYQTVWHIIPM